MTRSLGLAAALTACLTASLALTGCVSLFPKSPPATLYKLNIVTEPPAAPSALAQNRPTVLLGPITFTRAAGGDRILTTNGLETAFIADARWVAPAPIMFQEQIADAFDHSPTINLATRGEAVPADYILRVDVSAFETQYEGQSLTGKGKKPPKLNAPNIHVQARVTLLDVRQKATLSEQTFTEDKMAADNRVSAIVQAYDAATGALIGDIVKLTTGLVKS